MVTTCVHYRREGDTSLRMVCAVLPTRERRSSFTLALPLTRNFCVSIFQNCSREKFWGKTPSPHSPARSKLLFWRLSLVTFDASAVVVPPNRDDQISSEVCLLSTKVSLLGFCRTCSLLWRGGEIETELPLSTKKDSFTGYSSLGKTQPATHRLNWNQSSFCLPVTCTEIVGRNDFS